MECDQIHFGRIRMGGENTPQIGHYKLYRKILKALSSTTRHMKYKYIHQNRT